MTNRSNSYWRKRQTINGLKRKEVEIALKRYVAACEREVQAFIDRPTPESLEGAKAALETFFSLFQRWVAPHLPSRAQTENESDSQSTANALQGAIQVMLLTFFDSPMPSTKQALAAALDTYFVDSQNLQRV